MTSKNNEHEKKEYHPSGFSIYTAYRKAKISSSCATRNS
jgi:hypothetical protein